MKNKITKKHNLYHADPIEMNTEEEIMPGTPPIGIGYTIRKAIGDLILNWSKYDWPIFNIEHDV